MAAPGAELYASRLERAAALAPERRGAEVAAFLEWHDQLEEAAAELDPDAPPERQAAAALRFLWAVHVLSPMAGASHPRFLPPFTLLLPAVAPLVRMSAAPGGGMVQIDEEPALLAAMEASPERPPSAADLARLLLYAHLCTHSAAHAQKARAHQVLRSCGRLVADAGAAEAASGQLAALAARHGPALPAAGVAPGALLPVLWHSLVVWLYVKTQEQFQLPLLGGAAAAQRAMRASAAALARLQPASPRGLYWLGRAAAQQAQGVADPHSGAVRDDAFAGLWRRAMELARSADDAYWICSVGDELAAMVLVYPQQAVPPREVAGVLGEARAALKRLRKYCPRDWWAELEVFQEDAQRHLRSLDAHLRRSPGAWQPALCAAAAASLARRLRAEPFRNPLAELQQRVRCDGCGQHSVGLRRCSRCHQAWFCGAACLAANWKRHKPACTAAAAAATAQQQRA